MRKIDRYAQASFYVQIAASIHEAVDNGELAPGSALDSGKALAQRFGVSRVTLMDAIKLLKVQGVVIGRPGAGYFVTAKPPPYDSKVGLTLERQLAGTGDEAAIDELRDRIARLEALLVEHWGPECLEL